MVRMRSAVQVRLSAPKARRISASFFFVKKSGLEPPKSTPNLDLEETSGGLFRSASRNLQKSAYQLQSKIPGFPHNYAVPGIFLFLLFTSRRIPANALKYLQISNEFVTGKSKLLHCSCVSLILFIVIK